MIYIKRPKETPAFLKSAFVKKSRTDLIEFYKIPEESRRQLDPKWNEWPEAFKKDLINELNKYFGNRCCFCGRTVSGFGHGLVEHFRPKRAAQGYNEYSNDHYWWLTLDWQNLCLTCPDCNKNKANWFPVTGNRVKVPKAGVNMKYSYKELEQEDPLILDPCNPVINPEDHFSYEKNGRVKGTTKKGEATISILELNRSNIVQDRLREAAKFSLMLKKLDALLKSPSKVNAWAERHKNLDSLGKLFSDYPSQPHVGMKRAMYKELIESNPIYTDYIKTGKSSLHSSSPHYITLKTMVSWYIQFYQKKPAKKQVGQKQNQEKEPGLQKAYIEAIEIKNFKSISYLKLSVKNETAAEQVNQSNNTITSQTPWLLMLGENGVGKSSVLTAITYALCGSDYLKKLNPDAKKILRHKTQEGFVKVIFTDKDLAPAVVKFSKKSRQLTTSLKQPYTTVLAYGSTRLPEGYGNTLKSENETGRVKAMNMVDSGCALTNPDDWLLDLYKKNREQYDLCAKAIKILIDIDKQVSLKTAGATEVKSKLAAASQDTVLIDVVNPKGGKPYMTIQQGKDKFSFEELSDGYKSVIALAVDVMNSMIANYHDMRSASGIILIDELGTHLHPRWRMMVVKRLRETFPNIQFLVTTHDPLCLKGINENEVVVLRRNEESKQVEWIRDLPNPTALRAEQLLASEFFGLYSTVDPDVEDNFNIYYHLYNLKKRTRKQEEDFEKVKQMLRSKKLLPGDDMADSDETIVNLGNSLREELIYTAVDKVLALQQKNKNKKTRQALKKETIDEVTRLWKALDTIAP